MDIKQLMAAKASQGKMDPMAKGAKMSVLDELKKLSSEMMAGDVKGLKKVTVAAPDKSGLEMGLDKAKDMMGGDSEDSDKPEDMEDMLDGGKDEAAEGEASGEEDDGIPSDPAEIDEMIQLLEAKKAQLMMKK